MGLLSSLFGGGASSSKHAANVQAASADKAIEFQEETRDLARADLAPFVKFGTGQINPLTQLLTPQGQADYLNNNPIFDSALNKLNEATLNNRAARGKLGSGGTLSALQDNYISTALPLISNQQNALFNAVNLGQSSAAGQSNTALNTGSAISDLFTQKGNAQASGIVGAHAANQQQASNLINLGMGVAGMFSDERLKEDIKEVDRDEHGGIYEFKYIGNDTKFIGRIAQDLAKKRPESVHLDHESGYFWVTNEFAPRAV